MDFPTLDCVDSSVRSLLPPNKDSKTEINASHFDLKEEENDEIDKVNQEAFNELYVFSLDLIKKNKTLKEESKRLNTDLNSSKQELRENEEVIKCVDSRYLSSLHNLSKTQYELNEMKIDYDGLNKENLYLKDQLKRQDKDNKDQEINFKEDLSKAQSKIQNLILESIVGNELELKLKLAYEELNNFKGIENELLKVKNENSTLKTQVTQLESFIQKYEDRFTQGEVKFEKLFKMGKFHKDMTGLGFDWNSSHNYKTVNTFVKGNSSLPSI